MKAEGGGKYLGGGEDFCVTYGDGLANAGFGGLVEFHRAHGRVATLAVVHPLSNFGLVSPDDESPVAEFQEKPRMSE